MHSYNKIAVFVAVSVLCLGGAVPAMADTEATPVVPVEQMPGDDFGNNGIFAVAPSCVRLQQDRVGSTAYAWSDNFCGYTVRYRMIWAWASDGPCVSVPNNRWHDETRGLANIPPHPYVSELRLC